MDSGRVIPLLLALLLLLGPFRGIGVSQEEAAPVDPAQASQSVEEEPSGMARFLTAVNIPARGGLCAINTLYASILMLASAGMRYGDADQVIEESCSGPWIITDRMIEESQKPAEEPDNWSKLGLP